MGCAKVGNGRGVDDAVSAFCAAVLTGVVIGHTPPAATQVDQQLAEEYFKEARALCERDGGRLWGVSLCAPLVIFAQSHSTRGAGTYTAELKLDETHNLLASPRARSCHIAREEHGATAQGGGFSK